ncbi:alcohol dehydrogenase catalytic domain-containing protein [Paraburkholderia heleia]|uniref:alcohol dehydrogenase catalytic domain-containing protein n=1 Tax=Paraburkholderia heleia TaxID=634127 RepID=UPI0031D9C58B
MDADIPETMLAWRVPRFGGVESLRQESVRVPEPRQADVLIEVQAAALNPVDLKTLQGRYPLVTQGDLPYTLGRDVAGVVVSRGEGARAWPQGARATRYTARPDGTQPARIVDLVEKGAVKAEVVERFAFDDTPRGFERLVEAHPHGKLVVMRQWHDAL